MEVIQAHDRVLGAVLDTSGQRASCSIDAHVLREIRSESETTRLEASSIGALVKIAVADRLLFGTLTNLRSTSDEQDMIVAEVEYIGEGIRAADDSLEAFQRGVTIYPHPGDELKFASPGDIERIYSPHDTPHIQVGAVYPTEHVRAPILFDSLLGRHFAVVGSSGTGKSTTTALILNRIIGVAPHSHVIILDPHGEYSRAFGAAGKVWNVNNLEIPYWVMSLQEHCEAFITSTGENRAVDINILTKCLIQARLKNPQVTPEMKITADSPVAYQIQDLYDAFDAELGRLEKPADAHHYIQLRMTIEQFFADQRFHFIFDESLWNLSLTRLIGDLMRIPGEGKPVSIIDLAGVPSEIVKVVVSTISRMIFDYAVWTPRERRVPILFVCEEAQRYLPRIHSEQLVSAERQLDRIAREGRKYGVCLALISQRPSELSETALSQCGTVISLRLNNERDQQTMKAILSEGARSFVDVIPSLQNRECIISGEGAPVPMRVAIDTLAEELTPASDDPVFSEGWNDGSADHALLKETVRRWREEG